VSILEKLGFGPKPPSTNKLSILSNTEPLYSSSDRTVEYHQFCRWLTAQAKDRRFLISPKLPYFVTRNFIIELCHLDKDITGLISIKLFISSATGHPPEAQFMELSVSWAPFESYWRDDLYLVIVLYQSTLDFAKKLQEDLKDIKLRCELRS
jgi:hypothetical protein